MLVAPSYQNHLVKLDLISPISVVIVVLLLVLLVTMWTGAPFITFRDRMFSKSPVPM